MNHDYVRVSPARYMRTWPRLAEGSLVPFSNEKLAGSLLTEQKPLVDRRFTLGESRLVEPLIGTFFWKVVFLLEILRESKLTLSEPSTDRDVPISHFSSWKQISQDPKWRGASIKHDNKIKYIKHDLNHQIHVLIRGLFSPKSKHEWNPTKSHIIKEISK